MSELQASLEFAVELCKFYNIDLFHRGFYRIRTDLRTSQKLTVKTETSIRKSDRKETVLPACVEDGCGISRTFRILYRNEEINLGDIILFRVHILVDSHKIEETLDQANFSLIVELWFTDQTFTVGRQTTITCVSSRTLQLNFSCSKGLHYHLPVIFDYFHLSAVTVTIHAMLIALHQPYIKKGLLHYMQSCTSRSGKPWIGSNSQRFNLWLPQSAVETVFSTQMSGSSTKCVSSNSMQLSHIQHTHREVCALLLGSYESLKKTVLQFINLLPPWQRQKMKTTDCVQEILSTSDVEKANENEEEIIARANSDIAQLCTENILLWQQFLDTFCRKEAIQQHLGKQHHQLRVRRFAEAFFVIDNPRQSAAGCYDQNYQNYIAISEMVRRSRYWCSLPSLPVHCVELDGDLATLPIIFEDQYQDIEEFARRRSVANGRKSGSELQISDVKLQDTTTIGNQEDCSCGIAEILESRSSYKRTTNPHQNADTSETKLYYTTDVEDYKLARDKENSNLFISQQQQRHSKSLEYLLKTNQRDISSLSFPLQFSYQLSKCYRGAETGNTDSGAANATSDDASATPIKVKTVESFTLPSTKTSLKKFDRQSYDDCDYNGCVTLTAAAESNGGYANNKSVSELSSKLELEVKNRFRTLQPTPSRSLEKRNEQRCCVQCTPSSKTARSIILIQDGTLKLQTRHKYIHDVLNKSVPVSQIQLKDLFDDRKTGSSQISSRSTVDSAISSAKSSSNDMISRNSSTVSSAGGNDGARDVDSGVGKRTRKETSSSDSGGSAFLPITRKLKESSSRSMPFIAGSGVDSGGTNGGNGADECGGTGKDGFATMGHGHFPSSASMPEFMKTVSGPSDTSNAKFSASSSDVNNNKPTEPSTTLKPPLSEPRTSSSLSDSDITSEQSGWVSSRFSSSTSSVGQITPIDSELDSRELHTVINGDILRAKLEKLAQRQNRMKKKINLQDKKTDHPFERRHTDPKVMSKSRISKQNQPSCCSVQAATVDQRVNDYPKRSADSPAPANWKPVQAYDDNKIDDLLPPRQFRDVPPPPEPFRDPPKPIDNVIYFTYEAVMNNREQNLLRNKLKVPITNSLSYSQIDDLINGNAKKSAECEYCVDENIFTGGKTTFSEYNENDANFRKYKEKFKEQINFAGVLYSDFPTLASTLPYFHISDEYRIFSPEGLHLIICVHGLDGNSADLRLVKTYIELGLPGANLEFLMSERNQGDTFSDFDSMTDRLVAEILYHIESYGLNPTKISFVGHSLGNIIIRAAIARPRLKHLLPRLHTFLSLSGPHLGTLYNSSGLVNMGLWFMQKLKKSGTLLQLSLRDSADIRKTFLYRLSQHCHLSHFQNILLFGSSQDRYVPLHSARIELCKAAIKDNSITGAAYREMVHNIIYPIINKPNVTFVRYDVHHVLPNTANSLIGRAAHIALLDSDLFIEKFLVVTGLKYFR